jgi:hypothetical protein
VSEGVKTTEAKVFIKEDASKVINIPEGNFGGIAKHVKFSDLEFGKYTLVIRAKYISAASRTNVVEKEFPFRIDAPPKPSIDDIKVTTTDTNLGEEIGKAKFEIITNKQAVNEEAKFSLTTQIPNGGTITHSYKRSIKDNNGIYGAEFEFDELPPGEYT